MHEQAVRCFPKTSALCRTNVLVTGQDEQSQDHQTATDQATHCLHCCQIATDCLHCGPATTLCLHCCLTTALIVCIAALQPPIVCIIALQPPIIHTAVRQPPIFSLLTSTYPCFRCPTTAHVSISARKRHPCLYCRPSHAQHMSMFPSLPRPTPHTVKPYLHCCADHPTHSHASIAAQHQPSTHPCLLRCPKWTCHAHIPPITHPCFHCCPATTHVSIVMSVQRAEYSMSSASEGPEGESQM